MAEETVPLNKEHIFPEIYTMLKLSKVRGMDIISVTTPLIPTEEVELFDIIQYAFGKIVRGNIMAVDFNEDQKPTASC